MITTLHETSAGKAAIQTITFKVGTCVLGLVLVATTPQGICAILLGSDEKALVGQLRSIFPRAALVKDSRELGEVLDRVVQFIETRTATLPLLLDIGGTVFQKRVWKELREIPAGQTATYKELALKLSATPQAIGEACAANTLAVVIPCHRVISSDGGLAGYRWGVNRKRLLLQREQEMFPDPQSLFAMPALSKGNAPSRAVPTTALRRARPRAEVVSLQQGDGVAFAVTPWESSSTTANN